MNSNRLPLRLILGTTVAAALMATTIGAAGATTTTGRTLEAKRVQCLSEIDRRVQALGVVETRIDAMPRLTAEQKAAEDANLQSTTATLNSVNRPAVTAATDRASLEAACHAVYADVRVFVVVLPQILNTVKIDLLNSFLGKLRAVSVEKAAAGQDTSSADARIAAADASISEAAAATASVTVARFNADPDATMAVWRNVHTQLMSAFVGLLTAGGELRAL